MGAALAVVVAAVGGIALSATSVDAERGDIVTYLDPAGGVDGPGAITTGPDGALWFASYTNDRIGRIDPASGDITTYTDPAIQGPSGIAPGGDGGVWFTSYDNDRVGRVDPITGAVVTYDDPLHVMDKPVDLVAAPDGDVWFSTYDDVALVGRVDTATGDITTWADPANQMRYSVSVAAGPGGDVWWSSISTNRIGRLDPVSGQIVTYDLGDFSDIAGMTGGPDGALWYAAEDEIARLDPDSGALQAFSDPGGRLTSAAAVATGPDGLLWFTNSDAYPVGALDPGTGRVTLFPDLASSLSGPGGIVGGPDGAVWFTDNSDRIARIDARGAVRVGVTAGESRVHAGDVVHFHVTLTNPSPVSALTGVEVLAPAAPDCAGIRGDLAPGASTGYDCTYTTTVGDRGSYANVLTVLSDQGSPVRADPVVVRVDARPALAASQSARGTVEVGRPIRFRTTVTNTGDVPLTGVAASNAAAGSCTAVPDPLLVGAVATVTCTHVSSIVDADVYQGATVVTSDATTPITTNASSVRVVAPPHGFADVPRAARYSRALDWSVAIGAVAQRVGGRFHPTRPATRAEAVLALWRLVDAPTDAPSHAFPDVAPDAPYADALDWAVSTGVAGARADGTFGPGAQVTRGQFASMVWNVVARPGGSPATSFVDVPRSAWFATAVDWAVANGVQKGKPDGTYRPRDPVTRASLVTSLFRYAGAEGAWASWTGSDLTTWRFQ